MTSAVPSQNIALLNASSNPTSFKILKNRFLRPGKEYGSAPLWVWNTRVTTAHIDSMMQEFKDNAFGGVMVHPRPGLITEYLSEDWLYLWKYAADKAKSLDMDIWIYDENSYPSGFAGGYVPAQMPESYEDGQMLKMHKATDNGKTTCSFEKVHYYTSPWYAGFSYVDLMVPGVTEKFIDATMRQGYEKVVSDEFGKTVKGIFSDEPNIESWDTTCVRWTPLLYPAFKEMWGYDLEPNLPSLFEDVGDYKKIRHNYRKTLLHLFIEYWAKPMHTYAEKNNLEWTGHYWEHEWPSPNHVPDNMAMYEWHQRPAIDMLFNRFDEYKYDAQFGNIRAVKELSSVANQLDKPRTLSETYGGAGWELTFKDMKRLADWEFVIGVNTLNQHLSYMSLEGARKYDYPPSFSYHNTWWKEYKPLNEYYARLSLALSSGKQRNEVLIIEPTGSAWMYFTGGGNGKRFQEIGQGFQSFITALEKQQVEYDLGCENIIKNHGKIKGNHFIVGSAVYKTVVLPAGMENIDESTWSLLKKYAENGGKILLFEDLQYLDGGRNKVVDEFLKQCIRLDKSKVNDSEFVKKYFSSPKIDFHDRELSLKSFYHQRRELADGQLLFLVNASIDRNINGNLSISGESVLQLNAMTGEISGYPSEKTENGFIEIEYSLPEAGSLLFFVSNEKKDISLYKPDSRKIKKRVETGAPEIKRLQPNVLNIDFCDLVMQDTALFDKYFDEASNALFYHHRFYDGNPWCTSVQFDNNILKRDTFGVGTKFDVNYHFMASSPQKAVSVVIEHPEIWNLYINEVKLETNGKWWLDKNFSVFELGDNIRKGKNTVTLKAPRMSVFAEIEPIYLIGDFGLESYSGGWMIGSEKQMTLGSWKTMSAPLYGHSVSYGKTFNAIPQSSYEVDIPVWKGTVANLAVNGKHAAMLIGNEKTVDISQYLKNGRNKVELIVTGSLKNTLGPFYTVNKPGIEKGMTSPWHWKYVESRIEGQEYDLLDYGLMQDFEIIEIIDLDRIAN
jgi:hypothetical protein